MGGAQNTVGVVMTYMTRSTAAVNVSSTQNLKTDKEASGFDSVLNMVQKTTSQTNTAKPQEISNKADTGNVKTKDVNDKSSDNANKMVNDTKEAKTVEVKETNGKEAKDELQKTIEEDGKALIKQIAEETEVTEEEIITVMQLLGLTVADLLNPENLIQVFNEVNTEDAGVNVIVDSKLSDSLQNLLGNLHDMRNEIMTEFDLTSKELDQAVQEINKEFTGFTDIGFEPVVPDKNINIEKAINATEVPEVKQELDLKRADKTATEIKEIKPENQAENSEETEIIFKPVQETSQNQESGSNKGNTQQNPENANPFNQLINNLTNQVAELDNPEQVTYTDRAQMENIVRQIADRITITAGETESSMELQLHPASLGNVNILLTSSKDGIVAKFTAQNQIVKEAVESQMVQLQQKFDEQGIKITSIEVTIASHAFEQNLQQEGNNQQGQEQQSKGTKSLRRINLAELDLEEEEELSEAELIAAQMMAYNGNSVDFSA
jgi:flagellar hook-length control protein FliK